MDGNGRWAKERGMVRTYGHKCAVSTLKDLCIYMADVGVKYCSLYAFSTENFKRDLSEVNYLMDLFMKVFHKEFDFLMEKDVKVLFSGRREPLPEKVLKSMDELVKKTRDNNKLVLNICLNYGFVSETVDMVKKIATMCKNGEVNVDDINPELIEKNLYNELPPLDYVIRTSGELRLSNFMMYQASYAEFYFPETLFPDFDEKEFDKALEEFNKRNRRFGKV